MHNFIQWCEEKSKDLGAVLKDVEKIEGETKDEARVRTGLRFGYPDAYFRSQYPDLYNPPNSASAPLDMEKAKNFKSKPDVGRTPL